MWTGSRPMPSNVGAMTRRVFEIGVYVLVAAVVVQFFLAGLGIFGSASLLYLHTTVGALVIIGMVLVQSLLLFPYHLGAPIAVRAISALHVVNGVAIFWVALQLMDRVRFP